MRKIIGFLVLFVVLNISTFYVLLFTSVGNSIVAPIIEENVNKKNIVDFKLDKFYLDMNRLDIKAFINGSSVLTVSGDISVFDVGLDLKYDLKIDDLSKFKSLVKQTLNGGFDTSGTIIGNKELLKIVGTSDVVGSDTSYYIDLTNFKPSLITFDIIGASIDKILYTVNQPKYADGSIDISGKIKSPIISSLDGDIVTKIKGGILNNSVVNEKFAMDLNKSLEFKSTINSKLKPYKVENSIDFLTTIANLYTKNSVINLKDNSINSDYLLKIADLSKLHDITKRDLKGQVIVKGDVLKSKDLVVSGSSDIFNGHLKFNLFNDDFKLNLTNIEIMKLTHMLCYPELFDSKATIGLTYNLKNKSGIANADLVNGHFVQNEFSSLINTFARFDITREVYKKVLFDSKINQNVIDSKLVMKSANTIIDVKNAKLDLNQNIIDSNIDVKVKKIALSISVDGNLSSPNVKIDTTKAIEDKIKNKAKEKITNDLGKKIDEKLGNSVGSELLKSIFGE